jgi:hypothetical protein
VIEICNEMGYDLQLLKEKITNKENWNYVKLTNLKAVEIRVRLKLGESQKSLAKKFGIERHAVSDVKLRKTWNNIPDEKLLTKQVILSLKSQNDI